MAAMEIWRGAVNAWECDENAHLNVRFWVRKAHEALQVLSRKVGLGAPRWRDRHIRFLKEARAGISLYAVGGFSGGDQGQGPVRAWVELRSTFDGAPAMTMTAAADAVLLEDGEVESARAPAPGHAEPRGLALAAPFDAPDREAARALGLQRVGVRAVTVDYCDGDGHVSPDAAIGYISDCIGNLYAMRGADFDARGDEGVGGVALEYRLVERERPGEGDMIEVWSGPTAHLGKVGRYAHWLIDDASGRAWCTAEAVVGFLDLKTRRLTEPTAEAAAVLQDALAPEARC